MPHLTQKNWKSIAAPMHTRLVFMILMLFAFASATTRLPAQSPADLVGNSDRPILSGHEESLQQLKLEGSPLSMPEPFLMQRDEEPEFTRELFRVEWRGGDPIDLYVIRPAHMAKPPVTIFLYGFPSETDRFRDNAYCRMVTQRGYAAVGFVSALTGQRFHGRGLTEWFVSELPLAMVTTVHDVQMVLNYLDTRRDLDASTVGMFGQGSGGSIAVLAASVDPRLKRIDLIDPWGDWPVWMAESSMILAEERPKLTSKEFLDRVAALDPIRYLPKIDASRLQLLDVAYDRDTPAEAKKAVEAAMPKGASVLRYATAAEFQAGIGGGDRFLAWLQPPVAAEKSGAPENGNAAAGTTAPR